MINNPEKFLAGFWNWSFLDECFEGKIKMSDLDGIVERRGHFFVLETKQNGVTVPAGQRIMFENMAKTGLITVVILWGKQNETEQMQVYYPNCAAPTPIKVATNEDVQRVAKWWSYTVDDTKIVSFKSKELAVYGIFPVNDSSKLKFNNSEAASVGQIMRAGADHLINLGKEQDLQLILDSLQMQLEEVS